MNPIGMRGNSPESGRGMGNGPQRSQQKAGQGQGNGADRSSELSFREQLRAFRDMVSEQGWPRQDEFNAAKREFREANGSAPSNGRQGGLDITA